MNNEKIVKNLKLLREAVEAFPEERLDLGQFKKEEPCHTLFCTAGLAASMPEFQEQGLSFKLMEPNWWQVVVNGEPMWDVDEDAEFDEYGPADALFGENAANNLFCERWDGARDSDLYETGGEREYAYMSDKALAIWRLDRQMEAVAAVERP